MWSVTLRGLLFLVVTLGAVSGVLGQDISQLSQQELEARVVNIFESSCARVGCHAGTAPQMGMALTEELFYGNIVNEPSRERPDLMRIDPGRPDSSYLIMKVKGAEGIIGAQMPFTGEKLSEEEIQVLEAWTESLTEVNLARKQQAGPSVVHPFDGWKVINSPTTRMVPDGRWLFLISHRFVPTINSGYQTLFGLDGSGIIFLNMGYAVTDELFLNLGRSNAANNVEFDVKYLVAQQQLEGGWPVGIALKGAVNWFTATNGNESIFRGEMFKYSGQLILTHALSSKVGVSVVPGVLFNPVVSETGESPHVTVGLAGRWRFYQNISLIGEWVLIPYGFNKTSIFGNVNRFDSWGAGVEIALGGHVFQVVVTNSLGLTTDGYLRGGDLDITDGKLRLGFNIYRILNF